MTARARPLPVLLLLAASACAQAGEDSDGGALPADARGTIDAAAGADAPPVDAPPAADAGAPDAEVFTRPRVNEFAANHPGEDQNEFVEILGAPETDYSDHTILVIEGGVNAGPGDVDAELAVGTTDGAGYFTTGFLSDQLENGSLTLLLVVGATPGVGGDIDADDDGTIDGQTWNATVDAVALVENNQVGVDVTYAGGVALGPDFDGANSTVEAASRIPNGADTDQVADWVRNDPDGAGLPCCSGTMDSGEALHTPGAPNQVVP